MYMASDPSQRSKVLTAFQEASSHVLNVARTWAFSDGGYRALQYSHGSYNEEIFKGLDFVICEARVYGIKLILSLVNNYDDFGGKKQYVEWGRGEGQYVSSDDDFFSNPVVKGYCKNQVKVYWNSAGSIWWSTHWRLGRKDDKPRLWIQVLRDLKEWAWETGKKG